MLCFALCTYRSNTFLFPWLHCVCTCHTDCGCLWLWTIHTNWTAQEYTDKHTCTPNPSLIAPWCLGFRGSMYKHCICKHRFQHFDSFFGWRSGSVNQACGTFHIDRDLHTTRTLLDKSDVDRSYAYFSLCSSSSPRSTILLPVAIIWKNFPSCQDSEQSASLHFVAFIVILHSHSFLAAFISIVGCWQYQYNIFWFIQAHWLFQNYSGRLNSQWVILPTHTTKYKIN